MKMSNIPFGTTDWQQVECAEHSGETGMAYWRTREFSGIRVRLVEYTPGYRADHWCTKGHILLCLEGELETELADGHKYLLTPCAGIITSIHRAIVVVAILTTWADGASKQECKKLNARICPKERQAHTIYSGQALRFR